MLHYCCCMAARAAECLPFQSALVVWTCTLMIPCNPCRPIWRGQPQPRRGWALPFGPAAQGRVAAALCIPLCACCHACWASSPGRLRLSCIRSTVFGPSSQSGSLASAGAGSVARFVMQQSEWGCERHLDPAVAERESLTSSCCGCSTMPPAWPAGTPLQLRLSCLTCPQSRAGGSQLLLECIRMEPCSLFSHPQSARLPCCRVSARSSIGGAGFHRGRLPSAHQAAACQPEPNAGGGAGPGPGFPPGAGSGQCGAQQPAAARCGRACCSERTSSAEHAPPLAAVPHGWGCADCSCT